MKIKYRNSNASDIEDPKMSTDRSDMAISSPDTKSVESNTLCIVKYSFGEQRSNPCTLDEYNKLSFLSSNSCKSSTSLQVQGAPQGHGSQDSEAPHAQDIIFLAPVPQR